MKYSIGDLIIWKSLEEVSTIIDYWKDYENKIYYEIEIYNQQHNVYRREHIGEERIRILLQYGSIEYYPVR